MNLIVHPEADEEIQAAVRYYEGSRPGLGDDFLAELRTHLERIADDPLSLPKLETAPKRLDIRRTLILRFKYVVSLRSLKTRSSFSPWHTAPDGRTTGSNAAPTEESQNGNGGE